jgi:hypothetical protein
MSLPHLFRFLVLTIGLLAATTAWAAKTAPEVRQTGPDTYTITKSASTGWDRDVDAMKAAVLEQAKQFCAAKGKELKILSFTGEKSKIMFARLTSATIVFKALDAGDPELLTPAPTLAPDGTVIAAPAPATPTDGLYSELMKLDDLRKRGVLTDEEFQAQKKKVLDRSK